MKPLTSALIHGCLRPMPMPKKANALMKAMSAMKLTKRCTSFSSSVSSVPRPLPAARLAMEPIMVLSPVLMTTP